MGLGCWHRRVCRWASSTHRCARRRSNAAAPEATREGVILLGGVGVKRGVLRGENSMLRGFVERRSNAAPPEATRWGGKSVLRGC